MLTKTELEALSHLSSERLMDDLSKLVTPEERVAGKRAGPGGCGERSGHAGATRRPVRPGVVLRHDLCAHRRHPRGAVARPTLDPCEVNPCAASGAGEGLLVDGAEGRRSELEAARARSSDCLG